MLLTLSAYSEDGRLRNVVRHLFDYLVRVHGLQARFEDSQLSGEQYRVLNHYAFTRHQPIENGYKVTRL